MNLTADEFKEAITLTPDQILSERQRKIQEYEKYVDEKLKVDLKGVLDHRDKIYEQLAK